MKKVSLKSSNLPINTSINLVASKSESNRALIINALEGFRCELKNLSAARDTQTMKSLLNSSEYIADVLDAGTTMRFLASYFAVTGQSKLLTGTPRMCERPIGILVDSLRLLGANIEYSANEGYPPLILKGFQYSGVTELNIRGDVSSQFISSILMIAPTLPKGLKINLIGEVGSKPYIEMTIAQMKLFGADVEVNWKKNSIKIKKSAYTASSYSVESDWSGASYWYSVVALGNDIELKLNGLRENSLQGDSEIVEIMKHLGVESTFDKDGVILTKIETSPTFSWDFSHCPDLAQTIAVICAAKGIEANFSGIESLKVKETDRVKALQNELKKIGADLVEVDTNKNYKIVPSQTLGQSKVPVEFQTYDDHRMAMAFAPLSMVQPIIINHPQVVAKSYPSFWEDFRKVAAMKEL
ncbi:MAG: 3-phosphoshikimate 1-carboxyvinyltransferase [Bacteroidota bacterium]